MTLRMLLEEFFRHYLAERDLEATLGLLTESVITIGTGEHEVAKSKEEFRALLKQEFEELPNPLEYELYDYMERIVAETFGIWLAHFRVRLDMEDSVTELRARFTGNCIKENGEWKIVCMHMSTPTKEQDENTFFPLHYGKNTMKKMSLESSGKLMELISESLPGGIMGGYLEEGYPLYTINNKMLDILGYTYEELIDATDEKMMNIIYPADRDRVGADIQVQMKQKNEYLVEYRVVTKDGRILWINDIGKKIYTEDGREAMLSIMSDITDRVKQENEWKEEAQKDPLTGLNNRKNAIRLIEAQFAQHDGGMLFICDIDNFKRVNDTRGHAAGDKVLVKLAELLKGYTKDTAILARLGGDEYILFFYESLQPETVQEMIRAIQQEFLVYMEEFAPGLDISLSVGGVERKEKEEISLLYQKADEALYEAKKEKGKLQFDR